MPDIERSSGNRVTDDMVTGFLVWARNYGEIVSYKKIGRGGRCWRITFPDAVTASGGTGTILGTNPSRFVPTEIVLTGREAIALGYGLAVGGSAERRAEFAAREWGWDDDAHSDGESPASDGGAELGTMPLTNGPGGEVIGSAEVSEGARGLVILATITDPDVAAYLASGVAMTLDDAIEDLGEAVAQDGGWPDTDEALITVKAALSEWEDRARKAEATIAAGHYCPFGSESACKADEVELVRRAITFGVRDADGMVGASWVCDDDMLRRFMSSDRSP